MTIKTKFRPTTMFFIFVILSFAGCATIFKGSTEKVDISSDPFGAKVYLNGNLMGKTPLEVKLQSNKTYYIEFAKDGYEKRTVLINNSVGPGWIVLDVVFGLFPVVIDAATGDWHSLDDDNVRAVLERQNVDSKSEGNQQLLDTLKGNSKEEQLSNFTITIGTNETKVILGNLVAASYVAGYQITNSVSEEVSRVAFKGIFGLSNNQTGPFEENSISIVKLDVFYIQVKSDLYYKVSVERKSSDSVTLNFTTM